MYTHVYVYVYVCINIPLCVYAISVHIMHSVHLTRGPRYAWPWGVLAPVCIHPDLRSTDACCEPRAASWVSQKTVKRFARFVQSLCDSVGPGPCKRDTSWTPDFLRAPRCRVLPICSAFHTAWDQDLSVTDHMRIVLALGPRRCAHSWPVQVSMTCMFRSIEM